MCFLRHRDDLGNNVFSLCSDYEDHDAHSQDEGLPQGVWDYNTNGFYTNGQSPYHLGLDLQGGCKKHDETNQLAP